MVQHRGSPQVLSLSQQLTNPVWLGELGHLAGLKYASTLPGGPSTASWTLQRPPRVRPTSINRGRIVRIVAGTEQVWEGVLDEPVPSGDGWAMTAVGSGAYGNSYRAVWTSWSPIGGGSPINAAIPRGLRWRNGITSTSGLWLGDTQDSASCSISDFLNSITVQGAKTWTVDRRDNTVTIIPLPTTVSRLLVCTAPVAKTVAEDVNSLWLNYEATADNQATNAPATYALANSTNPTDITSYGTTEEYYDLQSNGVMSGGAAQSNGNSILQRYQAVTYAGPFQVRYGQLLNAGGYPVNLATERAGTVCRLLLTDFAFAVGPATFITGTYEYDDSTQTATITPFQTASADLQSLLAATFPTSTTPG